MTPSGGDARPRDRALLRGLPPTVRDEHGRVRHGALTDEDTGLPNRLHFDVVFRLGWQMGGRGIPVTVILFCVPGIDRLSAADLLAFGGRLNEITRQMDMVARLDEDRFAVLLMDCNASGGLIAADRFRGELEPWIEGRGLTLKGGVAAWRDWMERPEDLMEAAEATMATAGDGDASSVEVHRG